MDAIKIDQTICFQFVMEATGVYHQKFAYFLDDRNISLSIVLPNKMSNYMRTLEIKTITDKTSSQAICRFGLERKLDAWVRPKEIFRKLQQLTRERSQIIDERTVAKNQDRKSTRLNSSHVRISYAVFCLKKKN